MTPCQVKIVRSTNGASMSINDWSRLERHCEFKENVWKFSLASSQSSSPILLVIGGESHFDHPTAREQLEALVARIPVLVSDAERYAMQSEYRDDIEDCGCITCDSVVVHTWDDLRVWFSLKTSQHRLLGVRVVSGAPRDVYCDHP